MGIGLEAAGACSFALSAFSVVSTSLAFGELTDCTTASGAQRYNIVDRLVIRTGQ
jgi:hypothetical protein